jgi:large repetitive protein
MLLHRSLQIKTLLFTLIYLIFDFFDCYAQNDAFLVKNINTAPGSFPGTKPSSTPVFKADLNGIAFFIADDGVHGNELWRSDGTEEGTSMVKDINPGINGSFIAEIIVSNGTLFFPAGDAEHGMELWKSDGTEEGTVLVADIFPGGLGSNPEGLTSNDETVFFSAITSATGRELWRSDGETNGTALIKDINPGSAGSDPDMLSYVGNHLYFGATTTEYGHELWKSDGLSGNAELVVDSYTGEQGVKITELIVLDDKIIFTTIVPEYYHGELQPYFRWGKMWASNIMNPSPDVISDFAESGTGWYPTNFTYHDHKLFFVQTTSDDMFTSPVIWITDGTAPGTRPVEETQDKTRYAQGLVSYHGDLYFFSHVNDSGYNFQMGKTDGTSEGTIMIRSSLNDPSGNMHWTISTAVVNDKIYLMSEPFGIWQSDGSAGGTQLVTGAFAYSYLVSGQQLYLGINSPYSDPGSEPYVIDQATTELRLIKDIKSSTPSENGSWPTQFSEYEGKAHFLASDPVTRGLWVSDGTTEGTTMMIDQNVERFVTVDNILYFSAGPNLYKKQSDQITLIKVLPTPPPQGLVEYFVRVEEIIPYKNKMFLVVKTSTSVSLPINSSRADLWISDGTETGTFLLDEIYQSDRFVNYSLRLFKDNLFFWTSNGLTQTDGTLEGTHLVKDIFPSAGKAMAEMNGHLFFVCDDEELWRTDGTGANTFRVKDINPYEANANYLTVVKSTLFFVAEDGVNGQELWKTDGTEAGTTMIKDISSENNQYTILEPIAPKQLTNINDTLYFSANDGVHGYELWKSDGTSEGTMLVKDLMPGVKSSSPRNIIGINDKIVFLGNQFDDAQHFYDESYIGYGDSKIWELNTGEARVIAGDYLFADNLMAIDTTVFFTATGPAGRELWAYHTLGPVTQVEGDLERLHAYPNPTDRFITISFPEMRKYLGYNVVDMLGRVVLRGSSETNGRLNVDLSSLASGSYLLRFTDFQYKPIRILKR